MEALRILLDEHQSLAAIIHAMRLMIREIEAAKLEPDFELLGKMVHYLDAYPEKRHHPNEDRYIFGPLAEKTAEGAQVLAQLARDHADSDRRIAALAAALQAYEADPAGGLGGFAQAFESYASFYRTHMMLEEREVLPLVRRLFTAEDWARADAAFLAAQDPLVGARASADGENFRRIFTQLVEAAPAPLGFGKGARPKQR